MSNAGTIQAAGTAGAGVTLGAGGVVSNLAGGTIAGGHGVEIGGPTGTVVNSGLVSGTSAAIYIATGVVANLAGGMITSATTGAQFAGYGLVTNAASATIAAMFAVVSGTAAANVDNGGLIVATPFDGIGVFLGVGGTVSNAAGGTIEGNLYGVDIENGARSLLNAGLVTASGGVAFSTTFGGPGTAYVGNTGAIVGSKGRGADQRTAGQRGQLRADRRQHLRRANGQRRQRQQRGGRHHPRRRRRYVRLYRGKRHGHGHRRHHRRHRRGALNAVYFRSGYTDRVIAEPGAQFQEPWTAATRWARPSRPCWN